MCIALLHFIACTILWTCYIIYMLFCPVEADWSPHWRPLRMCREPDCCGARAAQTYNICPFRQHSCCVEVKAESHPGQANYDINRDIFYFEMSLFLTNSCLSTLKWFSLFFWMNDVKQNSCVSEVTLHH